MKAATPLVVVLNSGSSSLKYKVFEAAVSSLRPLLSGHVQNIGYPSKSSLTTHTEQGANATSLPLHNHTEALGAVQSALLDSFGGESLRQRLRGMGHRVVHGLTTSAPMRVDAELMATIRQASALAPLHNPPNAAGIEAAMASFPDVPQVAVFDTAWHAGMPAAATTYALPRSLCEAQRIRRYGFHGTSYAYLSGRLAERLGRPVQELSAVLCHLGAGSSMACMRHGRGVDTTMGLTPLEGLVMATRAGDLDPAIVTHLLRQGAGMEHVDDLLNKKSGLAGIAGTADMREIVDRAGGGDEDCRLALDVYVHRLRKYLGAYVLQLDGKLDAIVFSAGIGENSAVVRELACKNLTWLGIEIDQEKNRSTVYGVEADISTPASTVRVWVIPTDEEVSIAQQTLDVLQN